MLKRVPPCFLLILAILKGKNLYILQGTQVFTSLGIAILHYDKMLREITVFSFAYIFYHNTV